MDLIYATIALMNGLDMGLAKMGKLDAEEVRSIGVRALVDSGAYMMAINENIQEYLQLPVLESRKSELANGQIVECNIVGPLEVRFQNRRTICQAIVLPGDAEVLLGSIPLEDMAVLIHPLRQELIVNPDFPDMAMTKLKRSTRNRTPSTLTSI
jgi:clan AA aspartic protease